MRKYENVDFSYFTNNGLDDPDFIIEILESSILEFQSTYEQLLELNQDSQFDSGKLYEVMHKFKPTAQIFNLESYPMFQKYGSSQVEMEFEEFHEISDDITQNLKLACEDLKQEYQQFFND